MEMPETSESLQIDVCHAVTSEYIWYKRCLLPQGATVRDAIRDSGFEAAHREVDWERAGIGIFGQLCSPETELVDGDRVEIYRPLVFDPMESRRRRARHRQNKASKKGDNPNG